MLSACEVAPELPATDAVVEVYDARTGEWFEEVGADLEAGDTFVADGQVVRFTAEGAEVRGEGTADDLAEADATWVAEVAHRVPSGDDWVLVLGDGDEAGHWRISEVEPGERFAFQGRVFDTADVDADGDLEVRWSGDVLGRVTETHVRQSDVVIDLVVAGPDGTETITGTPEHPFWVVGLGEFVPMGELEVGTVLRTVGGGEARVASIEWREGDFAVFNFEVEGVHNYYVRAPGSDGAGVLVHNGCGPKLGTTVDVDAPGMSVRDFGVDTSGAPSGNYDVQFSSGSTYHGKGLPDRAEASAVRVARQEGDTIVSVTNTAQPNSRAAFKQEARNLDASGGIDPESPNYNQINSPGKKMLEQDGD